MHYVIHSWRVDCKIENHHCVIEIRNWFVEINLWTSDDTTHKQHWIIIYKHFYLSLQLKSTWKFWTSKRRQQIDSRWSRASTMEIIKFACNALIRSNFLYWILVKIKNVSQQKRRHGSNNGQEASDTSGRISDHHPNAPDAVGCHLFFFKLGGSVWSFEHNSLKRIRILQIAILLLVPD